MAADGVRASYGAHLASRMLPAFGLGVMSTFLFHRWGWAVSTPVQRIVFALGAVAVMVGLALDWMTPELEEEEAVAVDAAPADAPGTPRSHATPER